MVNTLKKAEEVELVEEAKITGKSEGGGGVASGGVAGTTATDDLSKIHDTLKLVLDKILQRYKVQQKMRLKALQLNYSQKV